MGGVGFLPAYQEPYAATGQLRCVKGMQDRASTESAREALWSQIDLQKGPGSLPGWDQCADGKLLQGKMDALGPRNAPLSS